VHHDDGDKRNNHPENIWVFSSQRAHMLYEHYRAAYSTEFGQSIYNNVTTQRTESDQSRSEATQASLLWRGHLLFRQASALSQALTFEFEAISTMQNAVENSVGWN